MELEGITEDIKASAYKVRGKLRAMKTSIEADEENSTFYPEKVWLYQYDTSFNFNSNTTDSLGVL